MLCNAVQYKFMDVSGSTLVNLWQIHSVTTLSHQTSPSYVSVLEI